MTATPLNPNGAILNTATPLRPKRSELLQLRTRRMVSTRPYSLSTVRHMAAMIGRNKNALHRGDAGLGVWNATTLCVPRRHFGEDFCTRLGGAPDVQNARI